MATVTNTIKLPDGTTPTNAAVEIELVASTTSRAAGWVTATDVTLLSIARPTVTNGAWTASLTPNADITPSGTAYKVTEYADRHRYIHYIEVDAGGGSVFDLLVDAPASLTTAASEVYADAAAAAVGALGAYVPVLGDEAVFDYYVDPAGSDSNDGLTPATAKATLAGVVALSTSLAGKRIGLKRGSTFREGFNLPAGGTANAPTVVGAYGTGARPIIKGSVVQATSGWSVHSGSVYVGTATGVSTAAAMWVDEIYGLLRVADASSFTGPGQYYSTSNSLYVWMPDSSNPSGHTFEKRNVTASLMVTTVSHYRIEDVSFRHAANPVALNSSGHGVVYRRCEVAYALGTGIYGQGRTIVEDCDVHHCWNLKPYGAAGAGNGILFTGSGSSYSIARRNLMWENFVHILDNSNAANVLVYRNRLFTAIVNGIDHQGDSAYVYNNFVHHRPHNSTGYTDAGHGIDSQSTGTALTAKNNVVYCDYTADNASNVQCMCVGSGSGHDVDYNLYYLTDATQTNVDIGKDSSSNLYRTLALWQAGTAFDDHSLSADPEVSSVSVRDCHPLSGSPVVDAGVAVSGVTDGHQGSAPDMGPFELPAWLA